MENEIRVVEGQERGGVISTLKNITIKAVQFVGISAVSFAIFKTGEFAFNEYMHHKLEQGQTLL